MPRLFLGTYFEHHFGFRSNLLSSFIFFLTNHFEEIRWGIESMIDNRNISFSFHKIYNWVWIVSDWIVFNVGVLKDVIYF